MSTCKETIPVILRNFKHIPVTTQNHSEVRCSQNAANIDTNVPI